MEKRRRRGRPTNAELAARAAEETQLPTFNIPTSDDIDVSGALEALGAADSSTAAPDGSQVPETTHTANAETPRDRSATVTPPAAAPAAPAAPPATSQAGRALTGKKYRGLKTQQLLTELGSRDKELRELRAHVAQLTPAAAAAQEEALRLALAVVAGAIGDVTAMFFGDAARLPPEQQEQLAKVWAPVIGPKLGAAAENLPIVAAIAATASVAFERFMAVKLSRVEAAQLV